MRPLVPLGLGAAAGSVVVWHAAKNAAPPGFDEAWYLQVSFRFWNALAHGSVASFIREWTSAFRFKAPLVSLLPLPLYAVAGPSYAAAVCSNAAALVLLAVSMDGLGRRFFSPAAGRLAAALSLLLPLTATLSRAFFVETWLTALTAAFLWRWAESDALHDADEAPVLGAIAGLGMLCKVLFPVAVAGPAAATLLDARRPWREVERPLKVLSAVAASVALTWYAFNAVYVAGYAYEASFGGVAAHYRLGSPLDPGVLLRFWWTLLREGPSLFVAAPLLLALAVLGRRSLDEAGLRFCLAWAAPVVAAASCGVSKDIRFTAAAMPAFALALAGALDRATAGRRFRPAFLAGVLVLPLDLFAHQAFGRSLLSVGPDHGPYGGPPALSTGLSQRDLVAALAARVPPGSVVVVGSEHARLNAVLLSAYAEQDRTPVSFVHYGHMEGDVHRVLARMAEKDATHILFVDGFAADERPPTVAQVDAALRLLAAEGRLPFRPLGPVPAGGGLRAELWERTGAIRMEADP